MFYSIKISFGSRWETDIVFNKESKEFEAYRFQVIIIASVLKVTTSKFPISGGDEKYSRAKSTQTRG